MNAVANPTNTGTDAEGFSKPVPTKFKTREKTILDDARKATGFSNSELIRRAVRLMGRQRDVVKRFDFLLELTT